jgi:hypothetical protein
MLDRNLELFKSRFCVAEWKRIDLLVLRGGIGVTAAVMPGEKSGVVGKQGRQMEACPRPGFARNFFALQSACIFP